MNPSQPDNANPETSAQPAEPTQPQPVAAELVQANTEVAPEQASGEADPAQATSESEPAAAAPATPRVPDLSPAACAAALAERFPALFGAGVLLPVKLRIHADIQQRAPGVFTRKSLSMFLHRHTTSTAYIRALLAAATRFDLDGQPAGDISEEHRAAAVTELDRRKAIVQEKRAAQHRMGPGRGPNNRAQAQATPGAPVAPSGPAGSEAAATEETGHQRPRRPEGPPGRRHEARGRPQGPGDRPPRDARGGPAPGPGARAPRPAAHAEPQPPRPPRKPRPEGPHPETNHATQGRPAETQAPPAPLDAAADAARRERGALLRAFEGSTLTKANFLVLKRMTEADLDAQLAQARAERQEWQERHPAPPRNDRNDHGSRGGERPGRPDRPGAGPGRREPAR